MERYIDAEQFRGKHEVAEVNGKLSSVILYEDIVYAPTADVVPKSEVDSEIKVWQELYADTVSKWEKAYEELEIKLENAKAEVAREIFEEISKASVGWGCYCVTLSKGAFLAEDVNRTLAELKKKYTEGERYGN